LIEQLATRLAPVEPLWRPESRAVAWLLGSALYVGALALSMAEPGIASNVVDARFLLPQLVAVVTGFLAVRAAFASVVPGYTRSVVVWPVVAALVWVATLAAGSLWPAAPTPRAAATHEWVCVGLIVVGGAPLVVMLAAMLRRGAPLSPAVTGFLAAIAVGALANIGACFSFPHADDGVTLLWHGGAILALVLVCAVGGRFVLSWGAARSNASPRAER
jgi:hypothetical protein